MSRKCPESAFNSKKGKPEHAVEFNNENRQVVYCSAVQPKKLRATGPKAGLNFGSETQE